MDSESSAFVMPEEKSANSMMSRSAISLCSERLFISNTSAVRKVSEDSNCSAAVEQSAEKQETNVNKFERLLLNMNKRIHDNFLSNSSEPFQKSDDLAMMNLMQKKIASYNGNIAQRSQSETFKAFSRDLSCQSSTLPKTSANRDLFISNASGLSEFQSPLIHRDNLQIRRRDTHDLSNPVGIKLEDYSSTPLRTPGNGLREAMISNLPPLKVPLAFKSNISSPMTPMNFSPAPKYPYCSNKLSSFSSNSSQFENYKILQALKSRKEASHGSQATQASIYEMQGVPHAANMELHREKKTGDVLLGMIKTINNASNVQQNCFSSLLDVMKVIPNTQEDGSENKMSFLCNQLNSLESLFSNVKGQLMKLETSLKDMSAKGANTQVKIEAGEEEVVPGKRTFESLMSKKLQEESDQTVKKLKL